MPKQQYESMQAVEKEIRRLEKSPYVKLARVADSVRDQRRQYMNELKALERRGRMLEMDGITLDYLQGMGADFNA